MILLKDRRQFAEAGCAGILKAKRAIRGEMNLIELMRTERRERFRHRLTSPCLRSLPMIFEFFVHQICNLCIDAHRGVSLCRSCSVTFDPVTRCVHSKTRANLHLQLANGSRDFTELQPNCGLINFRELDSREQRTMK